MRTPGIHIAASIVFICLTTISRAHGQLPQASHSATATVMTFNSKSSSGSTDRNVFVSQIEHLDDGMGFVLERETRALAETFGGAGGPPYRPQVTASAEAKITNEQDPSGIHYGANAEASSQLFYIGHILPTNNTGLVWHPPTIPVHIKIAGHVTGWGMATVNITDSATNQVYLSDSAFGLNFLNPKLTFDHDQVIQMVPDTYLRFLLTAEASAQHTLAPGADIMISSQALADPYMTFDQAAFDLYAASQGQPTFNLNDFFAFEFSEGIGNDNPSSVPTPGGATLLGFSGFILLCRRMRRTGKS